MIKDNQKVKLTVHFQPYDRYGAPNITAHIERDTYLEALKVMVDNMNLYIDSETIEDEGMSCEEIIGSIKETNGDGCDYIILLKDELSGEEIINESDNGAAEEVW